MMFESIYAPEPVRTAPESVELKKPLDFSYHFSRVTKARKESQIKKFYKYFQIPGIANLAGGGLKSDEHNCVLNLSKASQMPHSFHTILSKQL